MLSEKPDTEKHVLYNSTLVKFKSKQNQSVVLEIRRVVAVGREIVARRVHIVFLG